MWTAPSSRTRTGNFRILFTIPSWTMISCPSSTDIAKGRSVILQLLDGVLSRLIIRLRVQRKTVRGCCVYCVKVASATFIRMYSVKSTNTACVLHDTDWSVESQIGRTDYIAVTVLIHVRILATENRIMSHLMQGQAVIRSSWTVHYAVVCPFSLYKYDRIIFLFCVPITYYTVCPHTHTPPVFIWCFKVFLWLSSIIYGCKILDSQRKTSKHQIKTGGGSWPTNNSDLVAKYSHTFSRFIKSIVFNKLQ